MIDRPFISHFSPQRTDPELLEQIHVQRHDLLAESVDRVRESVLSEDKHHLLFIGPRGAGKTHLVRLIHHRLSQEVKTQPDLAVRLRFAWLNEDETATSFLKLLILIYRDVTQRYPQEFPAADLQSIYGQGADLARERLGESLLRHLGTRTLVVLMENLDSLFKHMPEAEQRIWRAFVQNQPVFTTVGTAQSLFDGVSSRDQPFFGFFDTQHLTPLNVEDAVQLLTKIARINGDTELADYLQTPTGHARVQAIHDLAGGNPRIYLIFSEFLTKESLDDLVRPFEETADRQLTSYYQERLRWLSPQQQEIIQFLCHQRDSVPVKAIADGLFTTHNSITGQLRQLRDYRYLKSTQVGREVLYELNEPLMRLALQMKDTHDRKPLALIVDFLRVWYDRKDLEQRLAEHSPESRAHAYFAAALSEVESSPINLRHEIWRKNLSCFSPYTCDDAMFAKLLSLAQEANGAQEWVAVSAVHLFRKQWADALESSTQAVEVSDEIELKAMALINRGIACEQLGANAQAVTDWSHVLNHLNVGLEQKASALMLLGRAASDRGDYELSVSHYSEILAMKDVSPTARAKALINRGGVFRRFGKPEQGIADEMAAAELEGISTALASQARYNLSVGLRQVGQNDEALHHCDLIISEAGAPADIRAMALINRALIKLSANDLTSAIADCTKVIDSLSSELKLNQLARAYSVRGMAYQRSGQLEAALEDYAKPFILPDNENQSEISDNLPPFFDNLEMQAEKIVRLLLAYVVEPETLKTRATAFCAHFSKYRALHDLFGELILQLPVLAESPLNFQGHETWVRCWESAWENLPDADRMHTGIYLRLLRAGVAYLKSRDEACLLTLPLEERNILREALDLPDEPTT
jgi:tetratricopeptide (TPR) repeat protein